MKKKEIHLVKSAFHAQFKTAMEDFDLPTDYYFRKVGLPAAIENPESLLPLKPFFHLINTVAIDNNIPDFGSRVAQATPWHKVSSLGPLILDSNNLGELLATFCDIASGQSTIVKFRLRKRGTLVDFCYTDVPMYKGDVQMELYRITSMIQLVHLATDSSWRPPLIRLNMAKTAIVEFSPLIASCNIRFSQTDSAISISKNLFELPLHHGLTKKQLPGAHKNTDLETDLANSIRQILKTYIPGGKVGIEEIARVSDLPVRSLQRRLRERGLKFNELLNQARFDYAKAQLENTGIEIKEVATSLGYSDAAHFSRAFRRWSGISPSAFAKQKQV